MLPYSVELFPVIVLLSLATGAALGQYWRARWLRRHQSRLKREARLILQDATRTGKAKIADAELQAQELLTVERRDFERERGKISGELLERERSIDKRLEILAAQEGALHEQSRTLEGRERALRTKEAQIEHAEQRVMERLAGAAQLSIDEARRALVESLELRERAGIEREVRERLTELRENGEREARRVLLNALDRGAAATVSDKIAVAVPLHDSDLKRRIIGRDGRNVRAFETLSGADLLVDELPDAVLISSHDPVRREVARRALTQLISDGRIQPARIEEFLRSARESLEGELAERGRQAAESADTGALHPEVGAALGRLFVRASAGQNVLLHLRECATFAGLVAAEVGLSPEEQRLCRRAALLHDIGKGLGERYSGPHAIVGGEFLRQWGEPPEVVNGVQAHHREVEDESIIAAVVRIADALSGARPGARREDVQRFLKRMIRLEELAGGFQGVERAYALNAGRELYVMVESRLVSDDDARTLSRRIAERIERELPSGPAIRISVTREYRSVSTADWSGGLPAGAEEGAAEFES